MKLPRKLLSKIRKCNFILLFHQSYKSKIFLLIQTLSKIKWYNKYTTALQRLKGLITFKYSILYFFFNIFATKLHNSKSSNNSMNNCMQTWQQHKNIQTTTEYSFLNFACSFYAKLCFATCALSKKICLQTNDFFCTNIMWYTFNVVHSCNRNK